MARTKFDILSAALLKIGANEIVSFNDGTRESQVAATIYPIVKSAELGNYNWNFTATVANLSRYTDTPTDTKWSYSFAIPADHIRTITAYDENMTSIPYLDEGNRIYANSLVVLLRYHADCNENSFSAQFTDALVSKLAYELCNPLMGDGDLARGLFTEYDAKMKKARHSDAQANTSRSIYGASTWLSASRGGYRGGWR